MEHQTSVDCESPPKKKHKLEAEIANKDPNSYAWQYFEVFTDTAKCHICQHEIGLGGNRSTTNLMHHLSSIHRLTDIRSFIDDFGSIPTMCVQSSTKSLCMHERVFQSFQDSSRGAWRCKHCPYTIQKRTLYPMFEHLKNVHWKPSKPNSGTTAPENHNRIVDDSPNRLSTDRNKTNNNILGDKTTHPIPKISENAPKTVQNIAARIPDNLSNDRDSCVSLIGNGELNSLLEDETIMDSNRTKHYKVRISLPDGKEVEGIYLGSDYDLSKDPQSKNAANLIHNYMSNEAWTAVSPIVLEKPSSSSLSNVQKPVAGRIGGNFDEHTCNSRGFPEDDQRKFDQLSAKAAKSITKPAVTPPRQTKFKQSFGGIETCHITKHDDGLSDEQDSDLEELEIQVPLQHIPGLNVDINRCSNGRRSPIYEYIKTEKAGERQNVAIVTLNRPKALNALCTKLTNELNDAVTKFNDDDSIGAIIITGSEKAFAAGNDIKEMQNHTYAQALKENVGANWNGILKASKPIIAAVNGYALGGGCELAMMCDIIYAGEKARFGQSEIIFGTIPGGGGTQRLTRAIGKSKAMEMMLTGNQISAVEAEQSGLISKVFPPEVLLSEAIKLGEKISTHSQLIVSMAKEAVNSAFQTKLQEGLRLENKIFCGTLATADRKEGIAAFVEKRPPQFKNE